jgi:hypothetical protein
VKQKPGFKAAQSTILCASARGAESYGLGDGFTPPEVPADYAFVLPVLNSFFLNAIGSFRFNELTQNKESHLSSLRDMRSLKPDWIGQDGPYGHFGGLRSRRERACCR